MSKKSPQLRFEGFTDDWEERKLGEIFNYEQPTKYIVKSTEYDDNFNTPVLTAGKSFLLGYTDEISGIKNATVENPVVIFDDFTTGSHYVDFPFKIKSSAMKLLSLNDNSDNFYFMFNTLKNIKYVPQSHERHWISKFSSFEIYKPSQEEQQKIGAFFKQLDETIALHQRKLDLLKEQKKGYLQKMFPKNGAKVPELRFEGFADDWEERKLGELVEQIIREVPKPNKPYYRMSVRSHAKGTFKQFVDNPENVAMDKLFVVKKDDLVVNITFAWEHAIAVVNEENDGLLVSHRFPTYRADGKSDIEFLHHVVSKENFRRKLEFISPGGAGRNRVLNKKDFLKLKIFVPKIEEQQKIGSFFKQLDNTIALHQRKLDLLKEQKKGFLQKMFI
ncbi:restriction endonuclease subunit S [Enterococcus faecalis]|uniref:restriction endonuclease subunit S n=1 Tax=Enterococcus TaxID=1350 RepID=UPI00115E1D5C|nr:restriction endonuclease subunit S [Enterococcus faecalis]EHQ9005423.1 restriction endonuclease subunit S [Enterococcus faecalis]MCD5250420.1 restriction endonuclease subunit S [Enterococcus faecalis]